MLFDGHHYIDGGYYSSDNADLAMGYERVLILALRSPPHAMRLVPIKAGVEALRASGALVEVIHPDEETLAALVATGGQMNSASGRPAAIKVIHRVQRDVTRGVWSLRRPIGAYIGTTPVNVLALRVSMLSDGGIVRNVPPEIHFDRDNLFAANRQHLCIAEPSSAAALCLVGDEHAIVALG
jgi:hypothetical protein